jgi:PAS domain S-box-containing protein
MDELAAGGWQVQDIRTPEELSSLDDPALPMATLAAMVVLRLAAGGGGAFLEAALDYRQRRPAPLVLLADQLDPAAAACLEGQPELHFLPPGAGGALLRMALDTAWQASCSRRRELDELRESKEQLEMLFNLLPVGVSVLDRERRVVLNNPALERILGVSQEGLLRGDYWERRYLHPDGSPMQPEEFASGRVLAGEASALQVETGVVKENGEVVWTEVSAAACPLGDWSMVIVTQDVTPRRLALQTYQEKLDEFQRVIECSPDAIFVVDRDYRLALSNPAHQAALRLTGSRGIEPGECVLAADYSPEALETWKGYYDRALEGETFQVETSWFIPGGQETRENTFSPLQDETGAVRGVLVVSHDITPHALRQETLQRSQAELEALVAVRTAELQDLYDHAPVGYHSLDAEGRVVRINQTALDWLGYTREEMVGHSIREFLAAPYRSVYTKNFPLLLRRGWVKDIKTELVCKDGSVFPVLVNATAVFDDQGRFVLSRSTLVDRRESRQAETALLKSEAKYRALFESQGVPIALYDLRSLKFLDANDAFSALYGYGRPELLAGMTPMDLLDNPQPYRGNVQRAYHEKTFAIKQTFHRKKNGEILPVEVHGSVHEWYGRKVVYILVHDISERVRAEEARRQSEAALNSFFDGIQQSMGILRARPEITDLEFLRMNRVALQNSGLTADALPGVLAGQHGMSETNRRLWLEQCQACQEGGQPLRFEYQSGRLTGHWLLVSLNRIEPGVFSYAAADISELKRMQGELERLNRLTAAQRDSALARYKTLFDEFPVGIAIYAPDGKLIESNNAAERMFGLAQGEQALQNRSATDWIVFDRSGAQLDFEQGPAQRAWREKRKIADEELMIRNPDGRQAWYLITAAPLPEPEAGTVAILTDISERHRTEVEMEESRRFQQLLFNSGSVARTLGNLTSHTLADINTAAEKMFGLQRETAIGQDQYELDLFPHPEDRQRGLELFAAEGEISGYEFEYQTPGGRTGWALCYGEMIERLGEKYILGEFLDITQRKQDEARIRQQNQELQALSRRLVEVQEAERRALALELHDELGQSLNSLKMALDLIAGLPPEEVPSQIAFGQDLAARLIDRVRRMSLELRPSMLDDLGLLAALNWLFKNFGEQGGLQVHFSSAGMERRFSSLVEITAYRIIQEALTNVLRHAGSSEAEVTAWVDAQALHLQVSDYGGGFDPESTRQGHASSGLSGMRERARSAGGSLRIVSEPGEGVVVSALLPIE